VSDHRFLLVDELPVEGVLPIDAQQLHHALRVLRLTPGERIEAVSPSGEGFRVEILAIDEDGVRFSRLEPLEQVWQPSVDLFQGYAKGDKMDTIVRQAVEVGVSRVVPVLTSRSVVRLDQNKRAERGERFRRIAQSAAEQAHRRSVATVVDPLDFSAALELLGDYDAVLVPWEDHRGDTIASIVASWQPDAQRRVALFVGPEGGLSADEVGELERLGAVPVTLGPSIMRTETAAIVSAALVVALSHELGFGRE
jgi:16S rRNA (uracil1498-N3)-methyltransferase